MSLKGDFQNKYNYDVFLPFSGTINAVGHSLISGDAVLNFTVNATGVEPKLYLFVSEDWKDAVGDSNCYRRLGKARAISNTFIILVL